MSIALQVVAATGHNQSATVTWGAPTTAGNCLLLGIAVNGGTTLNIHPGDTAWTLHSTEVDIGGSPGVVIAWYKIDNAPSRSGTETLNIVLSSDDTTASSQFYSVFLLEYGGVLTSSNVDQFAPATNILSSQIDTGTTPNTTATNDIAVVLAAHNNAPPVSDIGPQGGGASGNLASFVQTFNASALSGSATTAVTTVPAAGCPIGHTLILAACGGTSGQVLNAVADSKGNTWTVDKTVNATGVVTCSMASTRIGTALVSGDTITATYSAASSGRAVVVDEYQGLLTSSWVDTPAFGTALPGSATLGTVTGGTATAQAANVVVGAFALDFNGSSPVAGAGYTLRGSAASTGTIRTIAMEDAFPNTVGVQVAAMSWTGSSVTADILGVYKATSGGGGASSYTQLAKIGSSTTGATRINAGVYEQALPAAGSQFQFSAPIQDGTGVATARAWAVKAIALKTQSSVVVQPTYPPAEGLYRAGATAIQATYLSSMSGWTYYAQWNQLQDGTSQLVTINATGGTFKLLYNGAATIATAFNAAAATVQTNLRALAALGTNVSVAGGAGGPYTATFTGAVATAGPSLLQTNPAALTGGASTAVVTANFAGPDVAGITNNIASAAAAGKTLKVRLFCGETTPAWLTAIVGSFQAKNSQDAPTDPARVFPKFWKQAYLDAYDLLISQMAAQWDTSTTLVDVTISNAMTRYAEPLIRDLTLAQNRAELVGGGNGWNGTFIAVPGAGYTDALNKAAIKAGMLSHATWFQQTCSSFAFNPYQILTSYTTYDANDDATISNTTALIDYFKLNLSQLGVLENNSLRDSYFTYAADGVTANGLSTTNLAYQLMYAYMITYGPPSFFQTATRNPNRIGDFNRTLSGIVNVLGGNAVEPPVDYQTDATSGLSDANEYTPANFAIWDAALRANPAGGGTGTSTQKAANDSIGLTEGATLTRSRSGGTAYAAGFGPQWGGAYCNSICIDARDSGGAAVFGDFWGINATDDLGFNWGPRMRKLGTVGHASGNNNIYGRSIVDASAKFPGRFYHISGGLKGSYGGGWFGWTEGIATPIHFSSDTTRGGATQEIGTSTWGVGNPANQRPRCAGQLIAVDYDPSTNTEYIYALLTTTGGKAVVSRSTNAGDAWTDLWVGTTGTTSAADVPEGSLKAIELLDSDADGIKDTIVFTTYRDTSKDTSGPTGSRPHVISAGSATIRTAAAPAGNGVSAGLTLTTPSGAPAVVEDLAALPNSAGVKAAGGLVAACGPFGVYTTNATGLTWTLQSGTFFNSSWVSCVDATATNHIAAGCTNTGTKTAGGHGIATYVGASPAWGWVTRTVADDESNISRTTTGDICSYAWGDDVKEWWLVAVGAPNFKNCLGASTIDIQQIVISRANTQVIMVCSSAGGWCSHDFGGHWRPMTRGINGGITQNIKADTGADGTVYCDNLDYGYCLSTDNFQTGTRNLANPNPGAYKTGNELGTVTDAGGNQFWMTLGGTATDSQLFYKPSGGTARDIADDYFRAALIAVQCWDVTPGGVVVIGQYEATDIRVAKSSTLVSRDKSDADTLTLTDSGTATVVTGPPPPPPGGTGTGKHWAKRS